MLLLVGGYTRPMDDDTPGRARGLSAYDFAPHDGSLRFRGYVPCVNPSYVITDEARKIAYVVRECPAGIQNLENMGGVAGVEAFRIRRTGDGKVHFEQISDCRIEGDHPCHLALTDDLLIASVYTSGNVHVFPVAADGTLSRTEQRIPLVGDGPEPEQDSAHAHCTAIDRRHGFVYLCDLGSDRLRVFDLHSAPTPPHLRPRPELSLELPPGGGGGPRHIALTPDGEFAVVNCELVGKAHLLRLTDEGPRLLHTENYLPERAVDRASGAAVRIDPGGRNVYISERNFNLVTQLRIDVRAEKLVFRNTYPSGGEAPREAILSSDGEWLLAANMKTDSIASFRVGPKGALKHYRTTTGVPTPTGMAWLDL